MKAICPNKKGVLYKELMLLNNNDEGLSTYQHNIITDLMDQGLITEKRYKTPKGNFVYKIPKLMTEYSIANNLKGGSAWQIDLGKKQKLDKYISDNQINFIKTKVIKSGKSIYVYLSKANNITFEKPKVNPGPGIQGTLFSQSKELNNNIQGKQFQKLTAEEKAKTIDQITKEHRSITALKDLAAKLAHRIGGNVRFENNPNADWKGYNQGVTSVLNEAYMTPDTPFHEILAHPIIRAIKYINPDNQKTNKFLKRFKSNGSEFIDESDIGEGYFKDGKRISEEEFNEAVNEYSKVSPLYQSLLKELETGRGKEVFEQVKRDYKYKRKKYKTGKILLDDLDFDGEGNPQPSYSEEELERDGDEYTLEEQQEEAIVTLLGMMAANKLDAKKDKNLISLLKELLLQMSEYIKSLFTAKEIRISELNVSNLEFLTNRKIEDFIKSGKIRKEC